MSSRAFITATVARLSTVALVWRILSTTGRAGVGVARTRFGRFGVALMIGYLLGTIPTADVVARRAGRDLRREGTGNPGGANAMKVMGTSAGLQVMGGDIAKGAAACAVGGAIAGPAAAHLAGTAAVAGHCYPVWNGFQGGKGVAASVGQCLAMFPGYFPIDAGVAAVTAAVPAWKQRAFTASSVSSVCWVLGGIVWWRRGWSNAWGPAPTAMLPISAALSSAIIAERFIAAGAVSNPSGNETEPESSTYAVPAADTTRSAS